MERQLDTPFKGFRMTVDVIQEFLTEWIDGERHVILLKKIALTSAVRDHHYFYVAELSTKDAPSRLMNDGFTELEENFIVTGVFEDIVTHPLAYVHFSYDKKDEPEILQVQYFMQFSTVFEKLATPLERRLSRGLGKRLMCFGAHQLCEEFDEIQSITLTRASLIPTMDITVPDVRRLRDELDFLRVYCPENLEQDYVMFFRSEPKLDVPAYVAAERRLLTDPMMQKMVHKSFLKSRNNVLLDDYYRKNYGLEPSFGDERSSCDSQASLSASKEIFLEHCSRKEVGFTRLEDLLQGSLRRSSRSLKRKFPEMSAVFSARSSLHMRSSPRRKKSTRKSSKKSLKPRKSSKKSVKPRKSSKKSLKPRKSSKKSLKPRKSSKKSLKSRKSSKKSLKPRKSSKKSLKPRKSSKNI